MERGTRVIRKSDLRNACPTFGVLEDIRGTKVTVRWFRNGRQQHSTLAISTVIATTPEIEERVKTEAKARADARKAELDRERVYICMNVNPLARVSNQGHPKPLPLALGQTVDMKGELCLYCGKPVQRREGY